MPGAPTILNLMAGPAGHAASVRAGEDPIRVLVADDEPTLLSLIRDFFSGREDCRLELANDGQEALCKLQSQDPDLLITDLKMPIVGGEQLTLMALESRPDLTVLVITGNGTIESAVRLMKQGVFDFITKPFHLREFSASVDRAVEKIRSAGGSKSDQTIVSSLMNALEVKDPYLRNHSTRVAVWAARLGRELGLNSRRTTLLRRAAMVHDLGKIGVPESILQKRGPLSPAELSEIRKHPARSVRILEPLVEFRECLEDVYHHHEWVDGTGYPDGIAGISIPLGARILSVCDAYDAMASDRSYRPALEEAAIVENLLAGRGRQFDEDVVDMFLKVFRK